MSRAAARRRSSSSLHNQIASESPLQPNRIAPSKVGHGPKATLASNGGPPAGNPGFVAFGGNLPSVQAQLDRERTTTSTAGNVAMPNPGVGGLPGGG